jgi:iron complex outermembrane recepter protein
VKNTRISNFKNATAPLALALALISTPSFAQTAEETATEDEPGTLVVTGSILRRTTTETASPVTTVTVEELDKRGINTIQDAVQNLSANNGPALTNSFSANGAFASGASAVSLRGLSTNSTLVLFDGLRAAYYPLADDGSRNFVDLNTIPDDIVDRIEVLRDGASSSYGADAIAGVVNIITKKEFKGIGARAEAGISSRGDAANQRLSLTVGTGDLEEKGFNAYLSGFYYRSEGLKNSKRPYPFNSDDERQLCYNDPNDSPDAGDVCGPDNRQNGFNAAGGFGGLDTAANFLIRPANAANTAFLPGSVWQNLGSVTSAGGCPGGGSPFTLTAADRAANPTAPAVVCQYDYTNLYGTISPDINRYGISGRVTAKLNDTIEAYGEINFMQSQVSYTGFPATVRGTANTGILFPQFSTATNLGAVAPGSFILNLPIFVCPERVNCATSANRTLNPQNPFAAAGNVARIIGRDQTEVTQNQTRNRAYRAAIGVNGDLTDKINFDVSATAMHVDLRRRTDGYVYIQRLLDVINDGTYNFANPAANSQTLRDYLTPVNITPASSDQLQLQATLGTSLADLSGGPLAVGFGGSIRYEGVDAPSANDDSNGPTQRYFTLNAFGTSGSRTISSVFGEVEAPLLPQLTLTAAGRYDSYSSGQSAFSPKAGIKFSPFKQLVLRGTYSRGFRIPSFGEANALPTTGFVTNTAAVFNNTYLAQYGAGCTTTTFTACPAYIRSGSYGQTTLASPNLQAEKSRSFTAGVLFEPIKNVSFTVDFYDIKKTNVITQPSNAPALAAYYAGLPIPAGYTVIANAPDVNFPTATPTVAFVQSQLINANSDTARGLDFGADFRFNITDGIRWRTSIDASVILLRSTTFPGGAVERYDGTLGNYNLTAGSGTPKWKGGLFNSLDFGKVELNNSINFYGGYDLSAQDQGTGYKDCGLGLGGFQACRVPSYVTVDFNANVKVTDKATFYINMLNAFDRLPPLDSITYGAHLYNPVQGGNGIFGRQFRAGVRIGY